MSELKLKNCPFCNCTMSVRSNRDWHRPEGDHEDHCPVDDTVLMYPATDIGLSALVNCWNTRVPQPEATKPAQDLSVTMPYGWVQFIDGVKTQNFARDEKELSDIKMMFRLMKNTGKAEYLPVYASPADALVAGDSETAKDADVCIKPEAYLVTWQNGKRRTLAFNHWIPGQPEDSTVIPLARYGVEAVEEAFELAAKTIELFDDKTMEGDYMLDATECAGIIRALKPSAIAAIQAQKDGHG